MGLSVINTGVQRREGMIGSSELTTVTSSTSSITELSTKLDVSLLGSSTIGPTGGAIQGLHSLAAGQEGQVKWIGFGTGTAATGHASVIFTGTATGQHVLQAAADYVKLEFVNDTWMVDGFLGATLATVT